MGYVVVVLGLVTSAKSYYYFVVVDLNLVYI